MYGDLLGFLKTSLLKSDCCGYFFGKFGLLFISTCGHTARNTMSHNGVPKSIACFKNLLLELQSITRQTVGTCQLIWAKYFLINYWMLSSATYHVCYHVGLQKEHLKRCWTRTAQSVKIVFELWDVKEVRTWTNVMNNVASQTCWTSPASNVTVGTVVVVLSFSLPAKM